ncbi:MAG: hypothetical protein HDR04_19515 [Lachnospiraceae bacterium]|nr:hypothetical protein [Lachnospiraceae bacterium]
MSNTIFKQLQTPCYVFSKSKIKESYERICSKMKGIQIYYSLKANAEIPVIQVLSSVGAKFEVASDGEFDRVLTAGVDPENIICGLPVKKEYTIQNLYSKGCRYFVFDMISEYKKINKLTNNVTRILRVYINDLIPNSLEFGMSLQEIKEYVSNGMLSQENIEGISFHISNNVNIENFNIVWERICYIFELFNFSKLKSFILNIGGGYRNYAEDDFFLNLKEKIEDIKNKYPNIILLAEPGNTVVNESGILLSTVVGIRTRNGFFDIYMDAGKPTGLKTDNKRMPSYINVINKNKTNNLNKYRFIDLTCMHRPHFVYDLPFAIEVGDILEFGNMGAYSVCLQSMFHVWTSPPIYLID